MAQKSEALTAEPIRGFRSYANAATPTLALLRLDTGGDPATPAKHHWFLIDRKNAEHLAREFALLAAAIQPMQ